jgi:hypothetical protein
MKKMFKKLAIFSQMLEILNNIFKPPLVQKFARTKVTYILHWLSPFVEMDVKFGPFDKGTKNN